MRNIWLISDTHFNHANILNFADHAGNLTRPEFDNVEQMDECMIERWNSVVKPSDIVYHLGDVLFGDNKQEWMDTHWAKLHGKKRLVIGNHDNPKFLMPYFKKIMLWRQFTEFGLLLSHDPVHETALKRPKPGERQEYEDMFRYHNVHGHIHTNPSPAPEYHCVCVEQVNYTPVNIEELKIA